MAILLPQIRSHNRVYFVAIGFGAVLLLTLFVYWPGLKGGLLLDDFENLRQLVDDLGQDRTSFWETIHAIHSGPLGRAIAMLTFAANIAVSGPDVWALKFTNLLIHLLCGVLIFWLSGRLFALLRPAWSAAQTWSYALAVSACWLLAPLLVSTTLYTVQRMTQLSALFALCGLLAYVAGRRRMDTARRLAWIYILSSVLVWMPLAAFSKETGLLLPLLLLVVEIFVFRFSGGTRGTRLLYLFFLCFLAAPTAVALALLIASPDQFLGGYAGRPFTMAERILTEPRVLFYYLGNLLIPQGGDMGLFHDDYPVSKNLFTPLTTLPAIIGWAAVPVLAFALRRHAAWPVFFGLLFFFAGHALESGIFPLELVFEHRNYLPSFGIFFSLVFGIALVTEHIPNKKIAAATLVLIPLLYGVATYQRSNVWSSWGGLLLSTEAAHPGSVRVHSELAGFYVVNGELPSALAQLDNVMELRKTAESAVSLHRIVVYCKAGSAIPRSVYDAIPNTLALDDVAIYAVNSLRGITRLVYKHECPQLEIDRLVPRLEAWIRNAPPHQHQGDLWDVHYELAQLLFYIGRTSDALEHLRRADRLAPYRPEALLVMARYRLAENDLEGARAGLRELRSRFHAPSNEQKRIIDRYRNVIETIDNPLAGLPH